MGSNPKPELFILATWRHWESVKPKPDNPNPEIGKSAGGFFNTIPDELFSSVLAITPSFSSGDKAQVLSKFHLA